MIVILSSCPVPPEPPPPTYTVIYNGNGNTGGNIPTDTVNYEQGQAITVLGNTGNLVKSGYSFADWNTLSTGNGMTYVQGNSFTMGMANVTLFAKWTANPPPPPPPPHYYTFEEVSQPYLGIYGPPEETSTYTSGAYQSIDWWWWSLGHEVTFLNSPYDDVNGWIVDSTYDFDPI
jgi:uncharacterized repeat protein (TIGR02543 family)